jgi:hypothetical protein
MPWLVEVRQHEKDVWYGESQWRPDNIQYLYRSRRLLKIQNRNIQDEEKDEYSDRVDEMQVTTCCSSIVLIDEKGAGWSSMKSERNVQTQEGTQDITEENFKDDD